MDRLDAMSILLAAVEAGSLSAASRRLGIPLATVSRKVSELEAHLNARLLHRSSRRLTLTEAGQDYAAACRRILDQVAEAERAAAGEYSLPRGELLLTAPVVFGRLHVLPVVLGFLAAYPDIDIRMQLADRAFDLREEQVDLAVRIGPLPDSDMVAVRVGSMRRVVCASPAYVAARGIPAHPAELAAHDCITFDGLSGGQAWRFPDASGKSVPVPLRSRLTVTTAEAAADAAIAGLGLARLLDYQVAAARRSGALVLALEAFEPPPWPVSLVRAGNRQVPLKLRAFLDFATPRLKAALAADAAA